VRHCLFLTCSEFCDQSSEVRFLELSEPAASVFSRVVPLIGLSAHKCTCRLGVAKIDKLISHDLVDDAGQFQAGPLAFKLNAMLSPAKIVFDGLENRAENDIGLARVLKGMQPREKLPGMQAVACARVPHTTCLLGMLE